MKWEAPHYQETQNIPFIPTEQEIDLLIAGARPKLATIIQILKETGARIGELQFLTWTNIDTERKTIYITPEKGSNARILPLSDKLIGMVNKLPRKTERVFTKSTHTYQDSFDKLKRRVAAKIGNPRLLKIHPHTLRHWKGTMEYHKTKDIMHVKQVLGHKTINATMLYINTEQALFLTDSDEWTCKVARTEEEEQKLIEANFTFVNKREEPYTAFYRKRK